MGSYITRLSQQIYIKAERLGLFCLALTPVIDLILLITTSVDLMNGATAETPHAIAAVYISVSLVFGKSMIKCADDRFKYYAMKEGSKPEKLSGFAMLNYMRKVGSNIYSLTL